MHVHDVRPVRTLGGALRLALGALLIAVLVMMNSPVSAGALTMVKCTARPNADVGSSILGGIETRITWEGQADTDEVVTGLALDLPEGTSFGTSDARVTMLTGDDLMTRTPIDAAIVADGQTIVAQFDTPTEPGGYFRFEVYEVFFPASGGEMNVGAHYWVEGSDEARAVEEVGTITVESTGPADLLANHLEQQEWVQKWNSNKFLRLFLNPPILVKSFPIVVKGFFRALAIVLIAFPCAIPLGLLLALMRMSKYRVLRAIGGVYVNVVRGTPLFLQIYIAFFGLPLAGIIVPSFALGIIVLFMNSGAYLCEIFRAGIQSIPKGQFEASRSLGMNGAKTMFWVIIPQTIRRVLPTMTSEFILLYKDTSLLAAVGVMEVVMYAKTIVASTGSITPYIVAACFYLVITLPLAKLVGMLEARMAGNDTGAGAGKKKKAKKSMKEIKGGDNVVPKALREGDAEEELMLSPESYGSA